ncbi:MAG: NAD-dependent protein deacylase, partial [Candidatus Heimdallarchaeota archaeon]|nr:NAD-dependent protein deacylase [Candidatus Heimdallarchaeota archaeon]
ELASVQWFRENPKLVWEWYAERIEKTLLADPNVIHQALVRLENEDLLNVVITQNVDGLHRKAGQTRLIEIHGTITKTHCFDQCGIENNLVETPRNLPVTCECGSFQRPSVIWFGEQLKYEELQNASRAVETADLVLIVGTSGAVYPVAQFPYVAKQRGAKIVEFNLENAFGDITDLFFRGIAEKTLPNFVDEIIKLQ